MYCRYMVDSSDIEQIKDCRLKTGIPTSSHSHGVGQPAGKTDRGNRHYRPTKPYAGLCRSFDVCRTAPCLMSGTPVMVGRVRVLLVLNICSCQIGPILPSEYIPEYIRERLNRYADWQETASGGYANQSARGF